MTSSMFPPKTSKQFRPQTNSFQPLKEGCFGASWQVDPFVRVELGFTTRTTPLRIRRSRDLQKVRRKFPPGFDGLRTGAIQVHGARLSRVPATRESSNGKSWKFFGKTDGLWTSRLETGLYIVSADCLPLYIGVPGPRPFAAILHAGWRGTQKGIARLAIQRLKRISKVDPKYYRVWLGPCLRRECYEVGSEFKRRFPLTTHRVKTGGFYFDLAAENKRQLKTEGVKLGNIIDSCFCTACDTRRFYSYRREGFKAFRMISWIYLVPSEFLPGFH